MKEKCFKVEGKHKEIMYLNDSLSKLLWSYEIVICP